MLKPKIKRKTTRSLLRLPKWKDLAISTALFFISRASILGGFPCQVPFFAAICDSSAVYIYLPVIILSAMSTGANVIKYFLASFIYWLISEFRLHEPHRFTNSLYCGILIFLFGITDVLFSDNFIYSLTTLLTESILACVMYYAFSNTKPFFNRYQNPEHITREEVISFILLICSLLSGLSGIILPLNINISQLVGIYLILCVVMYSNITSAVTFAISVGFVSSSMSSDSILLMGIMAAGTIFASLLKMYGKYGIIAGFLAGVAICMLYIEGIIPISIFSLFFSSAMFLTTPSFIHAKMNNFFLNTFSPNSNENDLRIKDYISTELKNISNAFKNLSNQLLSTSEYKPYNSKTCSSALFDMVTSRVCSECPNSKICWRENLNDTCKQLFLIIDVMEEKGYCDMTNIPIVFSQKCCNPEKFITEFNHVYEIYKQDSLWQTEANHAKVLIAAQYSDISSIIREFSLDIDYGFYFLTESEDRIYKKLLNEKIPVSNVTVIENSDHTPEVYVNPIYSVGNERLKKIISSAINMPMKVCEDEKNTVRLIADNLFYPEFSVKQRIKEGQSVSGDSVLHFETDNGKFYVILCDGMGSGNEARHESKMTAELLKEFIKANIKTETAIKMINSSLSLKTKREIFSTVDILEINLLNGKTYLYKVGGAQSYIKCSGKFETVFSKSLPIGIIDDIKITHIKKTLKNNDMIVMVSDGISEADYGALRGEWVKKIMSYEDKSADELSTLIINDALKKVFPNIADDMTVIVIKLKKY